jgi:hypothetical protein
MRHPSIVERDLEHDIQELADEARHDRQFAVELYAALCNAEWHRDDGAEWRGGTWRYVAGVIAHLRGRDEGYLDFYCSGGEGDITDRVAEAMASLGWRGVGHGRRPRLGHVGSGRVDVLRDDGKWVVERPGTSEGAPTESELSLGEIADWSPAENWADWAASVDDGEG